MFQNLVDVSSLNHGYLSRKCCVSKLMFQLEISLIHYHLQDQNQHFLLQYDNSKYHNIEHIQKTKTVNHRCDYLICN